VTQLPTEGDLWLRSSSGGVASSSERSKIVSVFGAVHFGALDLLDDTMLDWFSAYAFPS
jgi:hypothetical protein